MISQERLFRIIAEGRSASYVRGAPYTEVNSLYRWHYEMMIDGCRFTDSYRGFNPYSGVEYVYAGDSQEPIWCADYVGYVRADSPVPDDEVYSFLKRGRGAHLQACEGALNTDFVYDEGPLRYETVFTGDMHNLLQLETFYHNGVFIAQQVTGGHYCGRAE